MPTADPTTPPTQEELRALVRARYPEGESSPSLARCAVLQWRRCDILGAPVWQVYAGNAGFTMRHGVADRESDPRRAFDLCWAAWGPKPEPAPQPDPARVWPVSPAVYALAKAAGCPDTAPVEWLVQRIEDDRDRIEELVEALDRARKEHRAEVDRLAHVARDAVLGRAAAEDESDRQRRRADSAERMGRMYANLLTGARRGLGSRVRRWLSENVRG